MIQQIDTKTGQNEILNPETWKAQFPEAEEIKTEYQLAKQIELTTNKKVPVVRILIIASIILLILAWR